MSEQIFKPEGTKDIRRMYPELNAMPEFKDLKVKELLMVWYYACPSSDIRMAENRDDRWRIEKAIEEVYGNDMDSEAKVKYVQLHFPETIKRAIERMKRFEPEIRSRSKAMLNKIFNTYENMVSVDKDSFRIFDEKGVDQGINFVAQNQYVNFCAKISEILPSLIKQVEEGFGVVDESGKDASGTKAIDRYHSSHK